jgi:hypothetical protein
MAFDPKIDVSFSGKCNLVTLTENTLPYTAGTNPGGWLSPSRTTDEIIMAHVAFYSSDQTPGVNAEGTGFISGTTFTDTTHISGTFAVGQTLVGMGIVPGTTITALLTGTGSNNGGTYQVSISQSTTPGNVKGYSLESLYLLKGGSIDVYATAIGEPTPGSFIAAYESTWNNPDGIYSVVYTVEFDDDSTYTNQEQKVLFLCNLCNCKDALIIKLINACDTESVKKLKEQVDQMEIFIYGIQSAFSCGDYDTADAIITAATTYCETISGCTGCGCGGNC